MARRNKTRRVKRLGAASRQQVHGARDRAERGFSDGEQRVNTLASGPIGLTAVPPPPPGAVWRVEQEIPGRSWQFHGYAKSELEKKELFEEIRVFGGRFRAVPLYTATSPEPGDGFIGDGEIGTDSTKHASKRLLAESAYWLRIAVEERLSIMCAEAPLEGLVRDAKLFLRRKSSKRFELALRNAPKA